MAERASPRSTPAPPADFRASIDTYIRYSEAVGQVPTVSRPAIETRASDDLLAENASLRAQLAASVARVAREEIATTRKSRAVVPKP